MVYYFRAVKRRDTFLFAAVALVCVAAGLTLALGGGSGPGPRPVGSSGPLAEPEATPAPEPAAELVETVAAPDAARAPGGPAADLGPAPKRGGIIDGQLLLAANCAGQFGEYTIGLTEMVNTNGQEDAARPRTIYKTFDVVDNTSPQYFAWHDVPYSRYGYEIRAFIKGFNGSHQVIRMTEQEWNPQVTLTVTRGAPFALRIIDQDRYPWKQRAITLRPTPVYAGLPQLDGTTDDYGSVVFESVLAAEYDLIIDGQVRDTVEVRAPGFVRDDANIGVQSALVRIPRGQELKVEVFGVSWAIPDVDLTLFRVDTSENIRFTGKTDPNGVFTFEHVPPGRYHLQLRAANHQPTDRVLRIEDGVAPDPFQVRMARLR